MTAMKDAVVEDLLGQIYAKPAQFELYLVLADRYEELGEDERAKFWRENAAKRRCCHWWHYYQIVMKDTTGTARNPPCGWGCKESLGARGGKWDKKIPNCMVPKRLFDLLPKEPERKPWWQKNTAEECWEALFGAWRACPRPRRRTPRKRNRPQSGDEGRTP
jgi:hypothetical protein